MDIAKLNQEILGVDLEYKNVYIDAENTRMIRAKLPDGYCDLVRTDVWNGRVNHPEEHDIVNIRQSLGIEKNLSVELI